MTSAGVTSISDSRNLWTVFKQPAARQTDTSEQNKETSRHWYVKTPPGETSGAGGCDGHSLGTVANTSHCKSPAESREPQRVLCVPHSLSKRLCSPYGARLPSQHSPLKTHNLSCLKSKTAERAASVKPFNLGSLDITTNTATRLSQKKDLEHLCSNCKDDAKPNIPEIRWKRQGSGRMSYCSCLLILGLHHA